MKLDLWDVELKHGDYIRKIIASKLQNARDDQRERVYQSVLKSVRKKAAAGYELKAEYGVKSLRTFLKRVTLRRVIDYLRKQTAEERRAGAELRQKSVDLDRLADESADIFARNGPRIHVESIAGVEVRPLLRRIRNWPLWIRWAMETDESREITRRRKAGWPDDQHRRSKTPKEIREGIAADYGISEGAVRLRLYRGRRRFLDLFEREKRRLDLRRRFPGPWNSWR